MSYPTQSHKSMDVLHPLSVVRVHFTAYDGTQLRAQSLEGVVRSCDVIGVSLSVGLEVHFFPWSAVMRVNVLSTEAFTDAPTKANPHAVVAAAAKAVRQGGVA